MIFVLDNKPKFKFNVIFIDFRFNGTKEPIISKVLEYKYIWYKKWGNYKPGIFQPYLVIEF